MFRVHLRIVCAASALLGLTACEPIKEKWPHWRFTAANTDQTTTASVPAPAEADEAVRARLSNDDDLQRGKQHFRSTNFGLAEQHFRRAVEAEPNSAEAWLGLAATYDRLRRFDLADRAYEKAIGLVGRKPEILNNQGYSYMLRGDTEKARVKFREAAKLAPDNPYVRNNRALLHAVERGKSIE